MKRIVLMLLRIYQRVFSADTGILKTLYLTPAACRFAPTCSEYTYQAVKRYGIIVGLRLGLGRILRCHPWNKGGWDPIPTKINK